jgi:ribosome-associated toxin RatA of RatAB toxin-antitoxin module
VAIRQQIVSLLCLFSGLGLGTSVVAEANVSITVQQVLENTHVAASIQIVAPHKIVWEVLTDYERLADFVGSLETSRLIEARNDSTFLVEQTNISRFAIFKRRSRVLSVSHHKGRERITTTFVEGDFHTNEFEWRLTSEDTDTEKVTLTYEATMRSIHWAPIWVVHRIVRKAVEQTLLDVGRESLRRAGTTN